MAKQREFAETFGIPFEATQGGAEATYPEYQLTIQHLVREEPARNAAVRSAAALGRPIPVSVSNPLIGAWILDRARSTYSDNTGPARRTMVLENAGTAIKHTTMTTKGKDTAGVEYNRTEILTRP